MNGFRFKIGSFDENQSGWSYYRLAEVIASIHLRRKQATPGLFNNLGHLAMAWYKQCNELEVGLQAVKWLRESLAGTDNALWQALTLHNLGIILWLLDTKHPIESAQELQCHLGDQAEEACLKALAIFAERPPPDRASIGRIHGLLGDIYASPRRSGGKVQTDQERVRCAVEQYRKALETLRPEELLYCHCLASEGRQLERMAELTPDANQKQELLQEAEAFLTRSILRYLQLGSRNQRLDAAPYFISRGTVRAKLGLDSEAIQDITQGIAGLEEEFLGNASVEGLRASMRNHFQGYRTASDALAGLDDRIGAIAIRDRPLATATARKCSDAAALTESMSAAEGRGALRRMLEMLGLSAADSADAANSKRMELLDLSMSVLTQKPVGAKALQARRGATI